MKIAIVGSRDFKALHKVTQYVSTLPKDTVVVSGGARGVDITAENAALAMGLRVEIYKPDWDKYGKGAGMIRNKDIVSACDVLVAFHNGSSRGTQHSIDLARAYGKQVYVFLYDGAKNSLDFM